MNKHKTFMRILLILAINIVIAVSVFFFFFGKQDFSSEQTLERLLSDSGSGNFRLDTLSIAVENAVSYPGFDGYREAMQEVENAVSQILTNEENISTGQIIYNRKLNAFLKDRNE